MAATLYSYGISSVLADIKTALNAKGLITSVLYENSTNLIFSTPLTTKVIRLTWAVGSTSLIQAYYGDAWTSGTTITNPISFTYSQTNNPNYANGFDVIADTTFFAICWKTGTNAFYGVLYVGKLDNGDALVFGMGSAVTANISAKDLTTGESLYPVAISAMSGVMDSNGKLYTIPLMWTTTTGVLKMNGTAIGGTVGVKLSTSKFNGNNSVYVGSNYYLTPAALYFTTGQAIYTSLLLEFTP